jgi:maleylacetoacetate isomerase
MATQPTTSRRLTLYSFFRSSCSTRVRFALHLKGLNHLVTYKYVDCARDEHLQAEYEEITSSNTLPCLVIDEVDKENTENTHVGLQVNPKSRKTIISQSLAILEYFEEQYPASTPRLIPFPPGLPSSSNERETNEATLKRAEIKNLALIVVADWQPLANLSPVRQVASLALEHARDHSQIEDGDEAANSHLSRVIDCWLDWSQTRGLRAYERYARSTAGRFSVGNELTLADIVLVPAVENWVRDDPERNMKVLERDYPTVHRIFECCRELDAYKKAHWTAQPDNNVGSGSPVFLIGGTPMAK